MSLIGADLLRNEDLPLLTGSGRYVADVRLEGELWARVVRSPLPHGLLRRVDVDAARVHPGVVAVIAADDVPDVRIPIRLPFADTPEATRVLQPPLARDRVRFVGEPVALVVAHDPYVAEDAAELVTLEIEELEAVVDPVTADAGPPIHPDLGSNVVNRFTVTHGAVDAAFGSADVVVRERLAVHRHTAAPLETRGLVADYDTTSGRLTIWGAAKVKSFNRTALSQLLDLPPERIRLVEVNVGGGFGVRGELYPEDVLVALAAIKLGRPVKWVEDRYEHLIATNHAREQVHEIEVAAAADGTLLAFRDRAWCDQGAYVRSQGLVAALLPIDHLPGPYAWRAFEIEAAAVLTNRTPVGTYRGPGMTEATFVRERMVDRVARELGLDPVEIRRRNLIRADQIPFSFDRGPAPPLVYESGDFPDLFERLLAESGYEELRVETRQGTPGDTSVGIGLSAYMEINAPGPSERAVIVPQPDGMLAVQVGSSALGQGLSTALAQIAADELGVPFERVEIRHRDTDEGPGSIGTFASRSTVFAGNAIALAARDLRAKAAEVGGGPVEHVKLAALVPLLADLGLCGEATYEQEGFSFSFGANLAVAEVDRETGKTHVVRYVVAHDVGRAVNPGLLRGQLAGAAAQGIAGALYEQLSYDESGQPLSTSFVDYRMPTAEDLPDVDVIIIEHRTAKNPLGIKGGGEAGIAGTLAAVANAVEDALGPDGPTVTSLPLTPDAVRALLRKHRASERR